MMIEKDLGAQMEIISKLSLFEIGFAFQSPSISLHK